MILGIVALFFLIVAPIGLGLEDSYDPEIYEDMVEEYGKDLLESPLYTIPDDYGPTSSPEPHPEFQVQVKDCLEKISDDCGVIIFNKIFDSGKYTDVQQCCPQLLKLGKKCHNAIIQSTIGSPEMKGLNQTQVWINNDNLWNECHSGSQYNIYAFK